MTDDAKGPTSTYGAGLTVVERFAIRFQGLDRAHGRYTPAKAKKPGSEKLDGKATTLVEPVTLALFQRHLAGTYGLGIVPVTDEATCSWGAIDIDRYIGLDLTLLEAQITRL